MGDRSKSGHRERLRERFITGEEIAHTDEALLELVLSYSIPQKDVQPLAKKLLAEFGSLSEVLAANFEALCKFDGIKSYTMAISFGYREVRMPSFAFVLHSELPEPGMYDIAKIETNRSIRAMLWNPDQILPSLYELRNQGLISKVSEIDNVRQFTTRGSLEKIVEHLGTG